MSTNKSTTTKEQLQKQLDAIAKHRFFYFVCTYWCEGNKGTVSVPLISESFPKMSVVLEIAEKFVAERFDVPTHKVSSVIVENWIEMSEEDFQQFNSK